MGHFYSPRIVTDGLVLALDAANSKSYSGTGTTWFDLSGNNNHGNLVNQPTFNSDNLGGLMFDGVDDYIQHDQIEFNETQPCTWSSWINIQEHAISPTYIFLTSGGSSGICLMTNNNYRFAIRSLHPDVNYITWSSNSIVPFFDKWINMVFVSKGNSVRLYINGDQFEDEKQHPVHIRHRGVSFGNLSAGYMFKGGVSQVKIYNKSLTPDEVLQNYNATKTRYGI